MKKRLLLISGVLVLLLSTLLLAVPVAAKGFVHGIVIDVDGEDYYLAGPNQLVGKHYNTGSMVPNPPWTFWSSDAPDAELLYIVHAIIDTWSGEKAAMYASRGYVHYHEPVLTSDGTTKQ